MQIMLTIGRGQHGSTYGGNPVAARVAIASLQVLVEEKLAENAARLGPIFREAVLGFGSPLIQQVSSQESRRRRRGGWPAQPLVSPHRLCCTPCLPPVDHQGGRATAAVRRCMRALHPPDPLD